MASGEFTGDNVADVAIGVPRGSDLTGKVGSIYQIRDGYSENGPIRGRGGSSISPKNIKIF